MNWKVYKRQHRLGRWRAYWPNCRGSAGCACRNFATQAEAFAYAFEHATAERRRCG